MTSRMTLSFAPEEWLPATDAAFCTTAKSEGVLPGSRTHSKSRVSADVSQAAAAAELATLPLVLLPLVLPPVTSPAAAGSAASARGRHALPGHRRSEQQMYEYTRRWRSCGVVPGGGAASAARKRASPRAAAASASGAGAGQSGP